MDKQTEFSNWKNLPGSDPFWEILEACPEGSPEQYLSLDIVFEGDKVISATVLPFLLSHLLPVSLSFEEVHLSHNLFLIFENQSSRKD